VRERAKCLTLALTVYARDPVALDALDQGQPGAGLLHALVHLPKLLAGILQGTVGLFQDPAGVGEVTNGLCGDLTHGDRSPPGRSGGPRAARSPGPVVPRSWRWPPGPRAAPRRR